MQQQSQQQEKESRKYEIEVFRDSRLEIPEDFKTGYHSLLVVTQVDQAHGAVREIKCRLCLDAKSKKRGDTETACLQCSQK